MRIFPQKQAWADLFLFPFKIYMFIAPIGLFLWRQATWEQHVRGALAAATIPIVLGYLICLAVFAFAAVVSFFTRRERVAENLMFAGIAFIIFSLLAPMSATA